MFITILTLGIANILGALTEPLGASRTRNWLATSWLVLLLLVHFNLFWHTLIILDRKDWTFPSFLYVVCGPILLFAATSALLADAFGKPDSQEGYLAGAARFFQLLAAQQLWVVGVDLIWLGGWRAASGINAMLAALALWLSRADSRRAHKFGAIAGWATVILAGALRGLGIAE